MARALNPWTGEPFDPRRDGYSTWVRKAVPRGKLMEVRRCMTADLVPLSEPLYRVYHKSFKCQALADLARRCAMGLTYLLTPTLAVDLLPKLLEDAWAAKGVDGRVRACFARVRARRKGKKRSASDIEQWLCVVLDVDERIRAATRRGRLFGIRWGRDELTWVGAAVLLQHGLLSLVEVGEAILSDKDYVTVRRTASGGAHPRRGMILVAPATQEVRHADGQFERESSRYRA